MTKYKISFACSPPGTPGCGCEDGDFLAEHGFDGSPEEAVKRAEIISWKKYQGDFRWWIVEDKDIEIDREEFAEAEPPRYTQKLSEELKRSSQVLHFPSEKLESILKRPSYAVRKHEHRVMEDGADVGYGGQYPHYIRTSRCIRTWKQINTEYDLYNQDLLVDRGKQKPGSSSWPHETENSLVSVREMIYEWNLVNGKQVSHVVEVEKYIDTEGKQLISRMWVYDFKIDDELMDKYTKKHKAVCEERERRFRDICERLRIKGTTL